MGLQTRADRVFGFTSMGLTRQDRRGGQVALVAGLRLPDADPGPECTQEKQGNDTATKVERRQTMTLKGIRQALGSSVPNSKRNDNGWEQTTIGVRLCEHVHNHKVGKRGRIGAEYSELANQPG